MILTKQNNHKIFEKNNTSFINLMDDVGYLNTILLEIIQNELIGEAFIRDNTVEIYPFPTTRSQACITWVASAPL